jgi:hypothetical protein
VAAARPVEDDDALFSVSGARGTKGLGPPAQASTGE